MDGRGGRRLTRIQRLAATALLLAGCAGPPHLPEGVPACDPAVVSAFSVWMVDYGLHTELVVPAAPIEGPLAGIAALFPGARTLSFGFGKRSFMTLQDPGLLDYVDGAIPGSGTVRVIGLNAAPGQVYPGRVLEVPLSQAAFERLTRFLSGAIARDASGAPVPVAAEPGYTYPGRFFAAVPGYSLAYTCNAWSVDGLHTAGLPVAGNVVFSSGAMREAASIRGACAPGIR